ncbi:MAG: alpha/beta hydrolase [Phycisphaerales bacterium]|nr:alpha/beta hydrolase [Phycisphaerales bacterium]
MSAHAIRCRSRLAAALALLVGASAPMHAAPNAPSAPAPPDERAEPPSAESPLLPVAESEVTFAGEGGFELQGTLVLPQRTKDQRVPAVLLIPGSGPTDRDGNQLPALRTDLLKSIATRLANDGIATLRFDKRACARYAASWPKTAEELNAIFGWEEFAGDVAGAYAFLRGDAHIDSSRVAVLGHSEGGLLALQLAHDTSPDRAPAALVLCATAGRTLDKLIPEQVLASLRRSGIGGPKAAELLAQLDEAIVAVRDTRKLPDRVPPAYTALFNPTVIDILHAYFTIDPAVLAAAYRGPVLVVNGANDVQVSAERDAPVLKKAFDDRAIDATCELFIVPATSHNLKTASSMDDPGVAGPVVPEALDRIAEWLAEELGVSRRGDAGAAGSR